MSDITYSKQIDKCLVSEQTVVKVLDFGQHSYADTFIARDQLNLSEPTFPLEVYLNSDSGHLQLGYASDPEARYNLYPYSYTSSNSAYSRKHWDSYAQFVKGAYHHKGLVVEVGSNDGYLIGQFAGEDTHILGIDPAESMAKLCLDNGIPCVKALFTNELAKTIHDHHGSASLIMANNVFNHSNNPLDFARGVSTLLSENGRFIFEVPYWGAMIEAGRFVDMVYHEHPSYFTVKSVFKLLNKAGLQIESFSVVDYHGGSLRVIAKKNDDSHTPKEVLETIDHETNIGLFDVAFYEQLMLKFKHQRDAWLHNFYDLKLKDPAAVIIGVGAAAKANTWLNWHGLNGTMLHCITDSSPHKQGKYTPLSRIPIFGDEEFAKHESPYALVLSWNIGQGLRDAILRINPNTRFITQ